MSPLGLVLYEAAVLAGIVLVLTLTGTPIVKFFVRPLSWLQCVRVCALATLGAFGIYLLVVDAIAFGGAWAGYSFRKETAGQLAIPALLGTGWLISYLLRRSGHPQSFPGVGAKTVIGWIILSWVAVAVVMFLPHGSN